MSNDGVGSVPTDRIAPVTWRTPHTMKNLLAQVGLDQGAMELEVMAELMDGAYGRAKELIQNMAPKDRAVLQFWAQELSGMVDTVQITEERY